MSRLHIRAGEVPELIQKTAMEFAGEFYDGERSPRFRLAGTEYGLSQKAYVRRYWPQFVDQVMQVLTYMLDQPGTPEDQKMKIYEAIVEFQSRSVTAPRPAISTRRLN